MAIALVVWLGFFWGKQRKEWTEEVALADGSKIEIERRLTLEKTYYDLGQAGLKPTFQWIRLPDGVIFETKDALIPLHLERGSPPIRWPLLAAPVYCATFDSSIAPNRPTFSSIIQIRNGHTERLTQRTSAKPSIQRRERRFASRSDRQTRAKQHI